MRPERRPHSFAGVSRNDSGTAAVEFALVLPLLLVIALAMIQVGLLVRDRLLVEDAARAGARQASLASDPAAIMGAARRAAPGLDSSHLSVRVSRAGGRGQPVTVTVDYASVIRVPFVAWLLGRWVGMRSTVTDRQEFG
jgi:Flp pilus assembly protein TadG